MKKEPQNIAASVRQRLLNFSTENKQDFQVVLARYAFERLLYRLSLSPNAGQFTLKGALLFLVWTGEQYRPTRDMDLMSKDTQTEDELESIFRDVCSVDVEDDGVIFMTDTITAESIRDDNEYGGMRMTMTAKLERASIPLQIDIGFVDAITPAPVSQVFPALLDFASPRISMYPPETAIAEKFHTIVVRGILNSRMKDYYDIWALSRDFEFSGEVLAKAIKATFQRRKTDLPGGIPAGLSDEFSSDASKLTQWAAFINRTPLRIVENNLANVVSILREFLMPPCQAASSDVPFEKKWTKGDSWRQGNNLA